MPPEAEITDGGTSVHGAMGTPDPGEGQIVETMCGDLCLSLGIFMDLGREDWIAQSKLCRSFGLAVSDAALPGRQALGAWGLHELAEVSSTV